MNENPYAPPQEDDRATGVLSGTRKDLKKVAQYQKGILISVLLYLVGLVSQIVVPDWVRPILIAAVLCVALSGAVCTFLLAMKTHGAVQGIVLGVLCFVPLVGLLVLLVVNDKATTVLRQNGISVGLLGANLSKV